jgi:myosin I
MGDRQGKKTGKTFQKQGVDDLVMLPKVTEGDIIDNLKKRYMNDLIYTNIGPVLISVNPYKSIPITGEDTIVRYRGRFRHELDPHVFALAEEAYRAMKQERLNQCVIIRYVLR